MQSLRRAMSKLDVGVYYVERSLLLVSLGLMTVLVSLDVLQRTFSRPVGKTESFLLSFFKEPGEAQRELVVGTLGPTLFWGLALVFFCVAVHSSRSIASERAGRPAPRPLGSLGVGLLLWALFAGLVKLMLWVFPSSVPGAQKFALGLMLWSGMLGASLATRARRHIVLDAIKKKVDPVLAKPFALLGGLATFAFCAFLALLGFLQLKDQYLDWASGEGIGVYDALPVPLWISTLAVPVTFATMAFRFLAQGIADFVWGPRQEGADSHGIDLQALGSQPADPAVATPGPGA